MKLIAIATLATLWAIPALADPMCGPSDKVLDMIKEKFQEVPTFQGMAGDNNNLPSIVTVSPEGSWTLVIMPRPGVACVVAGGQGWKPFTPTSETVPMPGARTMEPDSIAPMPGIFPLTRSYMRTISWVK